MNGRACPTWLTKLGALGLTFLVCSWLFKTLAFVAPPLVTDWSIRGTASPTAKYRLEDVSCKNVQFVFQVCSMSIERPTEGGLAVRPIIYAYFAPYARQISYRLLADARHPDWVTSDLGLDHLVNRTITLVIALVLLVPLSAVGLLGTFLLLRGGRKHA